MRRIDAHQHFWHYSAEEYGWIDDTMEAIRRDFLPGDLRPLLQAQGLDGAVAVQARQTVEETAWLLELAEENPDVIAGVVGWAPLEAPASATVLEQMAAQPKLVGLRHVVQAEPEGFLLRPGFAEGLRRLAKAGLCYDVLIRAEQLPEAIVFADAHPELPLILDHIAKPDMKTGELEPWRTHIRELARRPHVSCKLSGMVTEADRQRWTPAALQPFFETALEAFSPARLMAGSDWPVLEAACSYSRWWQTLRAWCQALTGDERARIFGGTAIAVYGLNTGRGEQ